MTEPQLRLPAGIDNIRSHRERLADASAKAQVEQQQREARARIHGATFRGLLEAFGYEEGPGQWGTIPREETRAGGPVFEWAEPPRLPAWGGASSIAPPEGYEGAGIPIDELPRDQRERRLQAHRQQMERQGLGSRLSPPETTSNENIIRKSRETLRKPSFQNLMREMNNPPGNR